MPPDPRVVWCLIQRGDYYLTARPVRWTLWKARAAVLPSRAVAQTFLDDFPTELAGAVIVPFRVDDVDTRT